MMDHTGSNSDPFDAYVAACLQACRVAPAVQDERHMDMAGTQSPNDRGYLSYSTPGMYCTYSTLASSIMVAGHSPRLRRCFFSCSGLTSSRLL